MIRRPWTSEVSRRALLAGSLGAAILFAGPIRTLARAAPDPVFRHGVASGDPDTSSVVLWTRLSPSEDAGAQPTEAVWELSESPDFHAVMRQGIARTSAARDFTVKVLADGLAPGAMVYYRFRVGDAISAVGRARTLPTGQVQRLGIALASCSNYAVGYFNAYDAIARDPAIDFVLHTGDYIYEYGGKDSWGQSIAEELGRVHAPAHEIVSLADYRERHAQYKTDAGARAMHANHTLLACWDDHESANNPWVGGAQNHQPDSEGHWRARRDASIQAYFEWMPVREPEWLAHKGRSRMQFWREYSFGDLAMLHTLETRHTARAEQIDYMPYATRITDAASAEAFKNDVIGASDRPMLSPELETDLATALKASVEAGQPWRIIASPMVIARLLVPDLVALGVLPDPRPVLASAKSPQELAALASKAEVSLAWRGMYNLPDYTDAWTGYPWARERLYDLAAKAGARDLVFLVGDSHSFWANSLVNDAREPVGIEFGTAGISSPGDFLESGFSPDKARELDAVYAEHIPEVRWTDNMHQGYVRVEFGRQEGVATFVSVDTVLQPEYRASLLRRFTFAPDNGSLSLRG